MDWPVARFLLLHDDGIVVADLEPEAARTWLLHLLKRTL